MRIVDDGDRPVDVTNAGFSMLMVEQAVRYRGLALMIVAAALSPFVYVVLSGGGLFTLMMLLIAAAMVAGIAMHVYRWRQGALFPAFRDSELRLGRCPACGYRLRDSAAAEYDVTCPECGAFWRSAAGGRE